VSLELWNTLGTWGTLLVIAATAFGALVQLRHMRRGNQIIALTQLQATHDAPEFIRAMQFVFGELATYMQDPVFRYQVAHKTERTPQNHELIAQAELVGDAFELMGLFAKTRLVERDLLLDIYSAVIVDGWERLSDVTAALRSSSGQSMWENFEYLTVLSQDFIRSHPNGTYPRGVRRLDVPNPWQSDDERYQATLAK
jgi:hypothetical protein